MSEVKLNLIDSQQTLHGTIHGSVVDSCVAALSAEPETIAELVSALARYIKPSDDHSPFASFCSRKTIVPLEEISQVGMSHGQEGGLAPALSTGPMSNVQSQNPQSAIRNQHSAVSHGQEGGPAPALLRTGSDTLDTEPWDAGLVVIDLAARIVSCESTYSMPQAEGEVHYHDGTCATDIPVMYLLPDDWLFVNSVEAYQWSRERRAAERLARTPIDIREVLYGAPLLNFIVNECRNIDLSKAAVADHAAANDAAADCAREGLADDAAANDLLAKEISNIHARWLMTPREDLRGQSPRPVLLERQDFIDFDLHTRAMQWSFLDEGPPCLPHDSHAYRFAGFGTHEWIIYYDLVRHLICTVIESRLNNSPTSNVQGPTSDTESSASNVRGSIQAGVSHGEEGGHAPALVGTGSDSDRMLPTTQVDDLDQIKTNWLESPHPDYGGRIPAILIDNERKRLPEAMLPRDMIIDDECPMCQMLGDETTPLGMGVGFWHLDGCNMDDDFAFSSYKTREEWETENRRRDEFNAEFNRKWEERQQRIARGETPEFDPFFDADLLDPFFDDPLSDSESDEFSLISSESADDAEELAQ